MKGLDSTALEGRVALITGCGRGDGIGAAIARCLTGAGAGVGVTDLPAASDGLTELASVLIAAGGRAAALPGDLIDESACAQIVRGCVDELGGLNILVNCAAAAKGADRGDMTTIPSSAWEHVINVNLRGPFFMVKHALPFLREGGHGRIINIGSLAAVRSYPGRAIYGVSKAGLVGFTVALAGDLAKEGITVNAVCPGLVKTGRNPMRGMKKPVPANATSPQAGDAYSWAPLEERIASADEIANVVAFFASDLSSYVTGQALYVDGGLGTVMNLG